MKRYVKQEVLTKEDSSTIEDREFRINQNPYEDIVLRRINKNEIVYGRAKATYDRIYNAIQYFGSKETEKHAATGADPLDFKSGNLMGKPIQVVPSNMFPLITEDYYVSTKADGLRFLLLIGQDLLQDLRERGIHATDELQFTHKKTREIFFVDSKLNFWRLESSRKIQDILYFTGSLDQSLIDGELLFFGDHRPIYDLDMEISAYIISGKTGKGIKNKRPYVIFLAFDILFGPMNPIYEYEKHEEKGENITEVSKINDLYKNTPEVKADTILFTNSAPKLGFKEKGRWETINRRLILQEMFINILSPLKKQQKIMSRLANFTILVSPFIDLDLILSADDPYEYSKEIYSRELNKQFREYQPFDIFELGNGNLSTDGIILTPKYTSYLIDTHSLGKNKLYKSKPNDQQTVDFLLGARVGQDKYECFVKRASEPYSYQGTQVFIKDIDNKGDIDRYIKSGKAIIVECNYQQQSISDDILFTITKFRDDKKEANARQTIDSILDLLHGPMKKYDILDLFKYQRLLHQKKEILGEEWQEKEQKYKDLDIKSVLSKDVNKQIDLCSKPSTILNNDIITQLKNMVKNQKDNELECRIKLEDDRGRRDNRDIATMLLKEASKGVYKSLPMVRYYKNPSNVHNTRDMDADEAEETYRVTFTELDEKSLILQDISTKRTISKTNVPMFKLYPVKCETVLSKENIVPDSELDQLLRSGQVKYDDSILEDIILNGEKSVYKNMLMNDHFYKYKERKNGGEENGVLQKYATQLLRDFKIKDPDYGLSSDDSTKKMSITNLDENINSPEELTEMISKGLTVSGGSFQYQVRHSINSLSDFWSIEVITYGSSNGRTASYLKARESYMLGPNVPEGMKTRIDIEYKPYEMYKDIIKYLEICDNEVEIESLNDKLFKKFGTIDIDEIEQVMSQEEDVDTIVEDYLKVVYSLLYGIYFG